MRPRFFALPACVFALSIVAACSGTPAPAPAATGGKTVDAATAGAITGRVTFAGVPPAPEPLKIGSDKACQQALGAHPVSDMVVVAADGGIQNAFVRIDDAMDGYRFETPAEPVILDQRGCLYLPRVFGARVGQPIKVLNSDETLHNVHGLPSTNQEFNQGLAIKGTSLTHVFTAPEAMFRFTCNVHPWMTAWVGVMAHPFFAVTDASGAFALKGVPPGAYTVSAWHEKFGTQTSKVTVGEKQTPTVAFAFSAAK